MYAFVADDYPNEPVVDAVPLMMDDFVFDAASAAEVGTGAIQNVAIWFFMTKIA